MTEDQALDQAFEKASGLLDDVIENAVIDHGDFLRRMGADEAEVLEGLEIYEAQLATQRAKIFAGIRDWLSRGAPMETLQ